KTLKSYSVTKEIISLSDKKLDKLEDSTFNLKRSEVLSKLVAVLISGFCFLKHSTFLGSLQLKKRKIN
ncbi:hypothetical protein, partial [Streptococcus pneumoniae]|uniref:hypothetical protein n=1 Tax=Streptococcus pneumoniae TaxID=1313 RepID=UPI00114F561D